MRARLAVVMLFLLSASLWALPDDDEDARTRYKTYLQHPAQLARLRHNWQRMQALPEARLQQVLELDRTLREQPSAEQARLALALERYETWLQKLPESERKTIVETPDKATRLRLIQERRDRDWMENQPRAYRETWDKLQGPARTEYVHKLRAVQHQRDLAWEMATRFWKELEGHQHLPARLADLPADVQGYVHEYLLPMLSKAEKERLALAEGDWPRYPVTLVELADRHPPALPGPDGPRTSGELPQAIQMRMKKMAFAPRVKVTEGSWPTFAIRLADLAANRGWVFPHELWPYNKKCLLPAMQTFVEQRLVPVLTKDEELRLLHSEGKWPDYPKAIEELARAHHLTPPWHTLPGTRERWQAYRLHEPIRVQGYPEVPINTLMAFAALDLDADARSKLNLSTRDPDSWQRLIEAYFRHYPRELERLRRVDEPGKKGPY